MLLGWPSYFNGPHTDGIAVVDLLGSLQHAACSWTTTTNTMCSVLGSMSTGVQCLVVCLQAQYRLILVVANGFSTFFIPSVPIRPSGKYQKSKIHWSIIRIN